MAEAFDILERVKTDIGLYGNSYHDETIKGYIAEVKQFMIDGGVKPSVVDAETSAGIISRGVSDLWNYGAGGTDFSPYFIRRVTQLAYKDGE